MRLSLLACVPLFGCAAMHTDAVRITALSPHPSIELPQSQARMTLDASDVPDSFTIPEQGGVTSVPVEQWQETLGAGFSNGLAPFFAAPRGGKTDYTLKVVKAELSYVPVQMYEGGGVAAVLARVSYWVEVVYRTGEIVHRLKGDAMSRTAWDAPGGSRTTAAEAVARMYEELAGSLRTLPKVLPIIDLAPRAKK